MYLASPRVVAGLSTEQRGDNTSKEVAFPTLVCAMVLDRAELASLGQQSLRVRVVWLEALVFSSVVLTFAPDDLNVLDGLRSHNLFPLLYTFYGLVYSAFGLAQPCKAVIGRVVFSTVLIPCPGSIK